MNLLSKVKISLPPLKLGGGNKEGGTDKKSNKITLSISGMHCTACSMNIDLDLEETKGIINSKTNYAKSISEISYNPKLISPEKIIQVIKNTGYSATIV